LCWISRARRRDPRGRQYLKKVSKRGVDDPRNGETIDTVLGNCGRWCVDRDPRCAAGRTEASQSSSNPTVEDERSAQHR